mmetsp:Transcript_105433/g.328676  ORF Transcript_105433/g.328676 Transcript_105433/m.328676 type:complete len:206 (-) Transcript_105433:197-814(-)
MVPPLHDSPNRRVPVLASQRTTLPLSSPDMTAPRPSACATPTTGASPAQTSHSLSPPGAVQTVTILPFPATMAVLPSTQLKDNGSSSHRTFSLLSPVFGSKAMTLPTPWPPLATTRAFKRGAYAMAFTGRAPELISSRHSPLAASQTVTLPSALPEAIAFCSGTQTTAFTGQVQLMLWRVLPEMRSQTLTSPASSPETTEREGPS